MRQSSRLDRVTAVEGQERKALLRQLRAREAAWFALHDALPPGWRCVGELTFDPASAQYVVAAMSPEPRGRGRSSAPVFVGRGRTELDAVRDLMARLATAPAD